MTHEELWRAIDTLAAEKGLSASGLAKLAGLDPTSFNKSKRVGKHGLRWPSTDSLARVLTTTGVGLDSFASLVGGARALATSRSARSEKLPIVKFSELRAQGFSSLIGRDHANQKLRDNPDHADYGVDLDSSAFEPAFPEGSRLHVSPGMAVRPGNRAIGFTETNATLCIVAKPAPRSLDRDVMLDASALLHRIVLVRL